MFTGIVEELGVLHSRDGARFTFAATTVVEDAKVGDSIAVNGCCLTVTELGPGTWSADGGDDTFAVAIIPHTAAVTTLGRKRAGDRVNIEVDLIAKYVERLLRGTRREEGT